jgi:hypothetical protein
MIALVPTPARAAGLGDTIDQPGHPPITTPAALLMIGAAYLLFFGRGILNALEINRTGQVLPALDYSAFPGVQDTVTRLAQIAGALLVLWLFCRHLQGPPRTRRHPPLPRIAHPGTGHPGDRLRRHAAGQRAAERPAGPGPQRRRRWCRR